jgi:hypothetical protein
MRKEYPMKRKVVVFLAILSLSFPLFSRPSANDVAVAMAAITDSSICAVAAFLNKPSLQLPGCTLYVHEGESLPYAIAFSGSDIGDYLPVFDGKRQDGEGSFMDSLLQMANGPLNSIAMQYLTIHDWKVGHASLEGVAVPYFGEQASLPSLMASVLGGEFPQVAVATDVTVDGTRVSEPVRVEGVFLIHEDAEGYFEVKPIQLKINGEETDV